MPLLAVMAGTFAWLGLSRTTGRHGFGWALLWATQAYLTSQSFRFGDRRCPVRAPISPWKLSLFFRADSTPVGAITRASG